MLIHVVVIIHARNPFVFRRARVGKSWSDSSTLVEGPAESGNIAYPELGTEVLIVFGLFKHIMDIVVHVEIDPPDNSEIVLQDEHQHHC
jgi:hypothetical protein